MELSSMNDVELIEGFKRGSHDCFEELISRYTDKAYNLAMRLTRNAEDAEEVLHDAFLAVFRKVAGFEGKSAFSSWFYRITVNSALMKLRKRRSQPYVSLEDIAIETEQEANPQEHPDKILLRGQLRDLLETAIAELPDDYRTVFILRDVEGLSNREAGVILNISVPAVKSRLHRARLMLRKRLEKNISTENMAGAFEDVRELIGSDS